MFLGLISVCVDYFGPNEKDGGAYTMMLQLWLESALKLSNKILCPLTTACHTSVM